MLNIYKYIMVHLHIIFDMNDVLASSHWYPRFYPTNPLHTYTRTHTHYHIYIIYIYIFIYGVCIYNIRIRYTFSALSARSHWWCSSPASCCRFLPTRRALFRPRRSPPGDPGTRPNAGVAAESRGWIRFLDGSMAQWMGFAWFCWEILRGFSDLSIKHIQTSGLNMFSP